MVSPQLTLRASTHVSVPASKSFPCLWHVACAVSWSSMSAIAASTWGIKGNRRNTLDQDHPSPYALHGAYYRTLLYKIILYRVVFTASKTGIVHLLHFLVQVFTKRIDRVLVCFERNCLGTRCRQAFRSSVWSLQLCQGKRKGVL